MKSRLTSLAVLLGSWLVAAVGVAEETVRLKHNPFSRPDSTGTPQVRDNSRVSDDPRPLDLRATMVIGDRGLANVAGKVIRPGQEADGYRLLKVLEDRAIFLFRDEPLVILVKPAKEEESVQ